MSIIKKQESNNRDKQLSLCAANVKLWLSILTKKTIGKDNDESLLKPWLMTFLWSNLVNIGKVLCKPPDGNGSGAKMI